GEVNYRHLLQLLDEMNYTGWVGCEYRPRRTTEEGLGWMQRLTGTAVQ
ncbi:MAG: hydroxypyruvate isomerase, partial [Pseudomonadota bacterium]|nr:hydroxypyruvate isomerase [Pseudomonadota bacterium]